MVVGGGNGTQPLKRYFCFKCFSVYLVLTCTLMWSPPDKRDSRSCAHVDAECVRAGITAEKVAWAGAAPEFAAQNACFCLPVLKQVCVNCLPLHPAGNTCDPWICPVLQAQDSIKRCEKSFFNWLLSWSTHLCPFALPLVFAHQMGQVNCLICDNSHSLRNGSKGGVEVHISRKGMLNCWKIKNITPAYSCLWLWCFC